MSEGRKTQFASWRKRWHRLLFKLGFSVPADSIFPHIGRMRD